MRFLCCQDRGRPLSILAKLAHWRIGCKKRVIFTAPYSIIRALPTLRMVDLSTGTRFRCVRRGTEETNIGRIVGPDSALMCNS